MQKRSEMPWEKLYDYVLACGSVHEPLEFAHTILDEMEDLIPFDQGICLVLDENRSIVDQHLWRMKSRWINMYMAYYSNLENTRWNFRTSEADERFDLPFVNQIIWKDEPMTEFIANYIMERGVKASLSFVLFDQDSLPRVAFSLDRTQQPRFTDREMETLRYAVAQLNNMFKKFFTDSAVLLGAQRSAGDLQLERLLTKREREVVNLLRQGLSPAHVATTLHISVSTAYKHIAHIYKKLGVSSQQELLVRVLGSR